MNILVKVILVLFGLGWLIDLVFRIAYFLWERHEIEILRRLG